MNYSAYERSLECMAHKRQKDDRHDFEYCCKVHLVFFDLSMDVSKDDFLIISAHSESKQTATAFRHNQIIG